MHRSCPFSSICPPTLIFTVVCGLLLSHGARADESRSALDLAPSSKASPSATGSSAPIATLLSDPNALLAWLMRMNPDVRAASARIAQSNARVSGSRVWQNPTLDLGLNGIALGHYNRLAPGYRRSDALSYSIGVSQTFEIAKRGPRSVAAKLHRDASTQEYRDTLLGLLSDARAAMTRVAYLGAREQVLEDTLASAQVIADLTKARLDRGDVSGVDHARLLLEAARVERDVADNRSELQDALADCQAVLFANCAPDGATLANAEKSASVSVDDRAIDATVGGRPDLRALRFEQRAATAEATAFRRNAIPDPTLGVTYTRDYDEAAGEQPRTLGISASIPLPFFDHGQYQALEADHRAEEVGAQERAALQRARSDAHSLVARRDVLRSKLENIQRGALPRAKSVVDSSTVAYERGQISMTDLLIARREHAALSLEEADTRFELFTVENQLERALGIDQRLLGEEPREER